MSGYLDLPIAPEWQKGAACNGEDPEWWFAKLQSVQNRARDICVTCPVRKQCADWALALEYDQGATNEGTFGGLSENQRRDIRLGREPKKWKKAS